MMQTTILDGVTTVTHGPGLRFLMFLDPECPCCRQTRSELDEVTGILGDCTVVEVDVWVARPAAEAHDVETVPSIVAFDGDAEILRVRGRASAGRILRRLRRETRSR